jgi:hypothetical protein
MFCLPLYACSRAIPQGHSEGGTLIVDDTNPNFHSDQTHVVERFTPMDENRIAHEATIEEPKVHTRPRKVAFNIHRNITPNYRNMEFSCWECEHDIAEKYTLESRVRR